MALGAAPAPAKLDVMQSARKLQREGELRSRRAARGAARRGQAEPERVRSSTPASPRARATCTRPRCARATRAADAERRVAARARARRRARRAGERRRARRHADGGRPRPAALRACESRRPLAALAAQQRRGAQEVIHDRAMGIKSRAAKAGAPALGGDADAAMAEENLAPPRRRAVAVARRTRAGHKPVTSAIRV